MFRLRFLAVVALIALLIPALGCGSRNRCCGPKPTSSFTPPGQCCPTPGIAPPPPATAGGF